MIPISAVLTTTPSPRPESLLLGQSREGRPIEGFAFDGGSSRISLIGGCHADEPIGPWMLERLVSFLAKLDSSHPLRRDFSWSIVPHTNPDGEAYNQAWTASIPSDGSELLSAEVDLCAYLRSVVRELPGDDIEFGFPRDRADRNTGPENLAIADFLRKRGPFHLHGSFHGMAFAAGPWFLIERSWADRTSRLRDDLRARVDELGYRVHDIDRHGDKGFFRIDEGFTSRPDSAAMAEHFRSGGDPEMAAKFRPSSMELVRSLGGDPFTFVSEMPLFLVPAELFRGENPIRPPALAQLRTATDDVSLRRRGEEIGLRPMPVGDQMRLQLGLLEASIRAVAERNARSRS